MIASEGYAMGIHQRLAEWSAWGWPLLANHLWQATLVALLAFVAARLLKQSAARARCAIWAVASAKFALPSALIVFLAAQAGVRFPSPVDSKAVASQSVAVIHQVAAPVARPAQAVVVAGERAPAHDEIYCALTVAWFTGCASLLFFWRKRRLQFARAVRSGRVIDHGREVEALDHARARLSIRRRIQLVITPRLIEPGVWGVCRPVVVFPESISDHLNGPELEAVMLHEMVHVARWDNLINSAQMVVCSLLWFHPLVWIIDRKLLAETESVCDERVLGLCESSKVYASSLLKVLRFCMGCKVAGVSRATGSNLRRRVEQIMDENSERRVTVSHRVLIAATVAAAVIFSVVAGTSGRTNAEAQAKRGNVIVPGGPAGGIKGGVPGGIPGGVAGGVPGGVEGGVEGGPSGIFAFMEAGPNWHLSPAHAKELFEELDRASDTSVLLASADGSPLVVTDARVKGVKVNDKMLLRSSPRLPGDAYLIKPHITLMNNADRRVTSFWVSLTNLESGRRVIYLGNDIEIEPHRSYTFGGNLGGFFNGIVLPGDLSNIELKVLGVGFDGGDVWGDAPPPPPPPPPPPAPQPPPPPQAQPPGPPPQEEMELSAPPPPQPHPPAAPGAPGPPPAESILGRPGAPGLVAPGLTGPDSVGRPLPPAEDPRTPPPPGGIGDGMGPAIILNEVTPEYPEQARRNNTQGAVDLRVLVDKNGAVKSVKIVRGLPDGLNQSAEKAVRRLRFKPATKGGEPVEFWVPLVVEFRYN
ncbi:MAG: TonB family protein [Blastocatellia bacterium]